MAASFQNGTQKNHQAKSYPGIAVINPCNHYFNAYLDVDGLDPVWILKGKCKMQDKKVINTFAITTKQGVIRNITHSAIMQPKIQFGVNPMNWFDDNKLLKKKKMEG